SGHQEDPNPHPPTPRAPAGAGAQAAPSPPPAGGGSPKGKFGGRPNIPDSPDSPTTAAQQALAIPEKCLVRFLDTDRKIYPGFSYEYRIQMRMSNPCYEKIDRAVSKQLTKDREIVGPWQEVSSMQGDKKVSRITIPEELLYYVVDEKDEDRPQPAATKDQAVVQVHRWIGEARTKPGQAGSEVQVGDWTVLKRRVVHRGEYLGRVEEV